MISFKKHITTIALLLTGLATLSSCESDELCEHKVNTPRLIVRFHNEKSVSNTKVVDNLIVYGEGNDLILTNASTDSIALPLKIEKPSTTYIMVSNSVYDANSGTITSGNVATVTFTYNIEEEFVSRACGIKVVYNTVSATVENIGNSWIKSINIKNTNVRNESNAQIHLFH
ncbi:DUF6452 family protein [Capnocytophaga sp.]|uniref:DUF6452 family protein n=1 Tax=Capnocytophaga sp. TaxID=44737 RepID=UPI0026DA720E|nr:DUF6452 family protein [Capnocytophaga sp.]MDO5104596.1 DUF6452 family protein [Capnocytophaga sp.]